MDPRVARTRDRALEAAERLLLTEGVDAVTLQRVAETAGVGRRTVYRHWADRLALLRDTMARTRAPDAPDATTLPDAAAAHLRALAAALVDGPLGVIVSVLHERGVHDPAMDAIRAELVRAGCEPLEHRLRDAVRDGDLPDALDVDAAVARLEGPVFHRALLHRAALGDDEIDDVVAAVLARPPLRPAPGTR